MDRRSFMKAIGLAPAAMLTAKAVAVPETVDVVEFHRKGGVRQTAMTCCENKHGYDYVVYDNDTGEKISEGFVPYPKMTELP